MGYSKSFGIDNNDNNIVINDYIESNIEYITDINILSSSHDNLSFGKIQETISWKDKNDIMKVSIRNIELSKSFDVDSVDSSYSCEFLLNNNGDDTSNIPSILSGIKNKKNIKFCIEKCLVTSENDRTRCFLLYDDTYCLFRIVICYETRVIDDNDDDNNKYSSSSNDSDAMNQLEQMLEQQKLIPYPITIFTLVSGTWLGDIIIRNHQLTQ